jgi:invasion protein IalB
VIAFLLRRLAGTVLILFAISALTFLIFFATPASTRPRGSPDATPTPPRSRRSAPPSAWTARCRCGTP